MHLICCFGMDCSLYVSVGSIWCIVFFKSSSLIDRLDDLPLWKIKYWSHQLELIIFLFNHIIVCFIHVGDLLLDKYLVIIVTFFMAFPFVNYIKLYFPLLTICNLQLALSDFSTTTTVHFWLFLEYLFSLHIQLIYNFWSTVSNLLTACSCTMLFILSTCVSLYWSLIW